MTLQKCLRLRICAYIRLFQTFYLCLNVFLLLKHLRISLVIYQTDLMADSAQTQIRIILTQKQTVLRTGSHHTVRLVIFLGYQIINQNANVRLGTIQNHRFPSQYLHSCVYACHKALYGCFLITGASIKLTAAEQSFNCLKLQRQL